ncbi:MAG: hypothetical protein AB1Z65_15815, partial [Candidatus Sulfomarinibacteraceae bacterium]
MSIPAVAVAAVCAAVAGAVPAVGAEISPEVLDAAKRNPTQRVFIHFDGGPETRKVLAPARNRNDLIRLDAVDRAIDAGVLAVDDVITAGDLTIDRA